MFVKVNNRPVTNQFNGLFGNIFNELDSSLGNVLTRDWNNGFAPVNIVESANGYHLEIAAPGRKKENFKLKVESQLLTVSYEVEAVNPETQPQEVKQIRKEFSTEAFKRTFNVDEKINADGILAKYEDGLLKVFLPKKEEIKPLVKDIAIG